MENIKLWDETPYYDPAIKQAEPYLTPFPVETHIPETGRAVIVVPGGGYGGVCKEHEGRQVALWLNSLGIQAFLLTYRVAPYRAPCAYLDLSRAVRLLRSRAKEFFFDPDRLGAIGLSAGGHLVASVATHFDNGQEGDAIDAVSNRLDFAMMIYPVISANPAYAYTLHTATFPNLLGEKQSDEATWSEWANERHVRPDMMPVFLAHAVDDTCVGVEHSFLFAKACCEQHVPVELHVYPHGGHGFGICHAEPHLQKWRDDCAQWLNTFVPVQRKKDGE